MHFPGTRHARYDSPVTRKATAGRRRTPPDAAVPARWYVAANRYHRETVPESRKHPADRRFLTYSSLARNARYGNRVACEVLRSRSPRLDGPVGSDESQRPRCRISLASIRRLAWREM